MSHFTTIKTQIKDIQALHSACRDLAVTSFKTSVVLTPRDALAIAGELLTVSAAQLKPRGKPC